MRDTGHGSSDALPNAIACSGDFRRAPQAKSPAARKEHVSAEVAHRYGVERDEGLDDAIPF